ncbi:ABC transporter permease [Roseicella sp. DB1501]|uniref:ABC transporter permease n=1 Tax=Roseicella sp. DB1501 TaxID=2730925 RepID=UPI001490DFD8|nr:ABC transporter permease [Roseicella sp. DB1501]NOG73657.1 ABC transporter permease [Roseicella sp. DB1501]
MTARPFFDGVNWIGVSTLYRREVQRFLAVAAQTVGGPVVSTLLFLAVFGVALGRHTPAPGGVPYLVFIVPGLVMMAILQNAFANTSSSLLVAKVQGNIVDLLLAPLGPGEFLAGLALGGVTRGLIVGALTALAASLFVPLPLVNPALCLFYAVGGALMFALLGVVGGLWAQKMDHQAAVTNFVIAPLTLLSGTFYAVSTLAEPFRSIAYIDPVFYIVDGFRHGVTGVSEAPPLTGVLFVLVANALLGVLCHRLLASGWRLRQ